MAFLHAVYYPELPLNFSNVTPEKVFECFKTIFANWYYFTFFKTTNKIKIIKKTIKEKNEKAFKV